MINNILYWLQKPAKGWDPVPEAYAEKYANRCYQENNQDLLQDVLAFTGPMQGKTVLDLGAGPGQFSLIFAEQGANVYWHDISLRYEAIFKNKLAALPYDIKTEIGYMEDARGKYDIIFNRVCWYYCLSDTRFIKHIYDLLNTGGMAYLIIPNEEYFFRMRQGGNMRFLVHWFRHIVADKIGVKLGHTVITTRRLKRLWSKFQCQFISFEVCNDHTIVRLIK